MFACTTCSKEIKVRGPVLRTWKGVKDKEYIIYNYITYKGMEYYVLSGKGTFCSICSPLKK